MRVDNPTIYRSAAGSAALADLYAQQLTAWPVAYTARSVATRHGETHVLLAGDDDAPPLVLFHDWGASAASLYLHYDLERLAARFRLVLPDTVGQPGRSAQAQPPSAAGYGEWATDILDALAIEAAFVAGSAGGGDLALRLAACAPDRVIRALVVASGGLMSRSRPSARVLAAALPLRVRPSRDGARRYIRALSAPDAPLTAAHEHVIRQTALTAEHAQPFAPPPALTDAELAQIRAPVYLLLGAADPTLRPQAATDRAASAILNAETAIIDGLGHLVTLDAPGLIENHLLRFFGALG